MQVKIAKTLASGVKLDANVELSAAQVRELVSFGLLTQMVNHASQARSDRAAGRKSTAIEKLNASYGGGIKITLPQP